MSANHLVGGLPLAWGRGSRVVKLSDPGRPCHEFEPNTTIDPPCRGAMHVKSVESPNSKPHVSTLLPPKYRGRGSLVVKVTDSWLSFHEFESSTTEDPLCRGGCTLDQLRLKRLTVRLVWKLGETVSSQMSSLSLDPGPSPKALE
ncbi:hypothetical protein TNCV_267581 [Trichonephila clavipes]|nr:hypothetical protein TNCV_267581 [Trichonephila clavipes]